MCFTESYGYIMKSSYMATRYHDVLLYVFNYLGQHVCIIASCSKLLFCTLVVLDLLVDRD